MAGTMLRTAENEAFAETLAGNIDQCRHICSGRHEPGTCVIRSGKATFSAMKTLSRLRSGKAKFVLPLLLLLPALASAATVSCATGTLTPTAVTATGPSANILIARAAPALAIQATSPAGTATVAVEMSCDGTNWAPATAGNMSLAAATPSQAVTIQNPTCT